MEKKTIEMMEKIMDTERMGYACVYPPDEKEMEAGHPIEEYLVAVTPENLADFISSHSNAHRITVTDFLDRPLLDVCGGFINDSQDHGMRTKILSYLAQIQTGEKEAGEVLQLEREQANAYFEAEDRAVTMAEYGMELG